MSAVTTAVAPRSLSIPHTNMGMHCKNGMSYSHHGFLSLRVLTHYFGGSVTIVSQKSSMVRTMLVNWAKSTGFVM